MTLLQVVMPTGPGPVRLIGELDISSAPALEEALRDRITTGGEIVLDLSELSFIDSTGLRALLWLGRQLSGRGQLILRSPSPLVARVIELTGVDSAPTLTIDTGDRLKEAGPSPTVR